MWPILLYAATSYVDAVVAATAAQYALEQGNIAREQERKFKKQQEEPSGQAQQPGV